ncbi:MAG: hypothetical protein H6832_01160 [Planctomycetes bacterium]|nr:hypothetical protein [Planctomycetota bacterium]MCB9916993.1 hypothetical protein [Planctomycetota bacterium]
MASFRPRPLLLASVLATLGACSTIETVNLAEIQDRTGLVLTENDAPTGARSLAFLSAHRSGFYLFGYLPMVRASFDHCMEQIVSEAKRVRADGVSNMRIEFAPASFFSLAEPVFPWMAHATITGMAYRLAER